tara:strand:+ start:6330 stop:6908 length:579 start_codon:yes stop_codon:yes gene_type:complete
MNDKIINKFKEAGALLDGHFILSSGLHSAKYIQCARVMMFPKIAKELCSILASDILKKINKVDFVASPAMGGILVGYEIARFLNVPAIFFERVEGTFQLRRGFEITEGQKCLMVEDIITTGLSSRECIAAIKKHKADVVGAACLIDRSLGKANIGVDLISLAQMEIETFNEETIPDWLAEIPVSKPGSRNLR